MHAPVDNAPVVPPQEFACHEWVSSLPDEIGQFTEESKLCRQQELSVCREEEHVSRGNEQPLILLDGGGSLTELCRNDLDPGRHGPRSTTLPLAGRWPATAPLWMAVTAFDPVRQVEEWSSQPCGDGSSDPEDVLLSKSTESRESNNGGAKASISGAKRCNDGVLDAERLVQGQ